ncbi:uncharacterized protein LOC126323790 [Schistocerca gregaria]|uniref:uncharacterized protein LOC126323790 n=1 Tax=Schistocerca gregaria TaxID=7010 RepID=UPI00211DCF88|nr:uncharacterized protein LOC126323790 [Schistocerca gregaria]
MSVLETSRQFRSCSRSLFEIAFRDASFESRFLALQKYIDVSVGPWNTKCNRAYRSIKYGILAENLKYSKWLTKSDCVRVTKFEEVFIEANTSKYAVSSSIYFENGSVGMRFDYSFLPDATAGSRADLAPCICVVSATNACKNEQIEAWMRQEIEFSANQWLELLSQSEAELLGRASEGGGSSFSEVPCERASSRGQVPVRFLSELTNSERSSSRQLTSEALTQKPDVLEGQCACFSQIEDSLRASQDMLNMARLGQSRELVEIKTRIENLERLFAAKHLSHSRRKRTNLQHQKKMNEIVERLYREKFKAQDKKNPYLPILIFACTVCIPMIVKAMWQKDWIGIALNLLKNQIEMKKVYFKK